jgi:hypothetical protein
VSNQLSARQTNLAIIRDYFWREIATFIYSKNIYGDDGRAGETISLFWQKTGVEGMHRDGSFVFSAL